MSGVVTRPAAVVVGGCSHGLAICRALRSRNIPVHLVEANPELPGTSTRSATLHRVSAIHGDALVESLLEFGTSGSFGPVPPLLFLTNDRMVGDVAGRWERLSKHFLLSWSSCRDEIRKLLQKDAHAEAAAKAGCVYPASQCIESPEQAGRIASGLDYPVIVKPSRPLSSFKARVVESAGALVSLCRVHATALPALIQPYIPGGDDRIRFTAFYLRDGRPLARFEGRKLQSRPMGHTTIAEPFPDAVALENALRFFESNRISGPASLEIKLDADGRPWIIEPTVGRTDFWLQLCVSNGINLPWIEYCDMTGQSHPEGAPQADGPCWLNTDRDRLALLRYLGLVAAGRARARKTTYSFLSLSDPWPWYRAVIRNNRDRLQRLARRLTQPPLDATVK